MYGKLSAFVITLCVLTGCAEAETYKTLSVSEGIPSADPQERAQSQIAISETQPDMAIETASTQPRRYVQPEAPIAQIEPANSPDTETRLARQAGYDRVMARVEERQRVFAAYADDEEINPDGPVALNGTFSQGGLIFGQTLPRSAVRLDGKDVMVDDTGRFVLGFGRDSALTALLTVTLPDGEIIRRTLELADKTFAEQRIDGLDQSKVSGFTEAQLEKIYADQTKKNAAREKTHDRADWAEGFEWPVTGRISGVFGSRRILNGEPKRPHSGVDVAGPTGTPVRAPVGGIVTLAEEDMYFEGGLILLDHGHWVESAFLHLSRLDVEPGQRVEKGDIIGAIGATGRATGPHLHWSVRWLAFNRLVDPQLLVGDMPTTE